MTRLERLLCVIVIVLAGAAACGQEQSQTQSVRLGQKQRSAFTAAQLHGARAWLVDHPDRRNGWRRGVILAVATGDRAPLGTWFALLASRNGFIRLSNAVDDYDIAEYKLLMSPGDAITWEGDDNRVHPDEVRLVAKQVIR